MHPESLQCVSIDLLYSVQACSFIRDNPNAQSTHLKQILNTIALIEQSGKLLCENKQSKVFVNSTNSSKGWSIPNPSKAILNPYLVTQEMAKDSEVCSSARKVENANENERKGPHLLYSTAKVGSTLYVALNYQESFPSSGFPAFERRQYQPTIQFEPFYSQFFKPEKCIFCHRCSSLLTDHINKL